jgi:replicative DNA helicase
MAEEVSMFREGVLEKYPIELLDKRAMTEGNVIACLWKNPELFKEYGLNESDFVTKDGSFFYNIGIGMYKKDYKVFDGISVATFISDKPIYQKYNPDVMDNLSALVDTDNADAYYDELLKSNILLGLHERGFNVVQDMNLYIKMTSEDVYQHFDKMLNRIFVKKQLKVQPSDMTVGYEEYLKECDAGKNLGISFSTACPLLSYIFAGLHKGNMVLHTAHSGVGKTSSAIEFYILPLLEAGEKVVIIANEQGERDWRGMLLATVISSKLGIKEFPRHRLQYGGFTSAEWQYLESAKTWFKKYEKNLMFVQLFDYSVSTIKKVIKNHTAMGFETFIYDTCKPEDETSDKAWAVFTENSKELFQIANRENIIMICTAQLSMATLNTRFLNGTCIGKSKAIKEVASQITMIRDVWKDEYEGAKCVNAYRHPRGADGKFNLKVKETIILDKTKRYSIVFVDKNRFGVDGVQLIYEKDLSLNRWIELGYCEPQMF